MASVSESDIAAVMAFFKRTIGGLPSCPICGESNWDLQGPFGQVVQEELPNLALLGQLVPTIALNCKRCFYVAHFHAGELGLDHLFS